MFTLRNFEQQFGERLLQKGSKYFQEGAVVSLEETTNDRWLAEVEGSDSYEVKVQLSNSNKVTHCSCNCPLNAPVCKHIVAVLLAIRDEISKPAKRKAGTSKRLNFEVLLQKISLKEYQDFIMNYASDHKTFKTEFELWFAAKDDRIDLDKLYKIHVTKIIRKYQDSGFIDYRSAHGLVTELDKLLLTGHEQIKKKIFHEAFALAKAMLMQVAEVMENCDDSDGGIGGIVSESIQLLAMIVNEDKVPRALKEQLLHFLKGELNKNIYSDFGSFELEMVALYRDLAVLLNKPVEFLRFLDEQLAITGGSFNNYRQNFLNIQKIEFLKATGRQEEAEKLVQQNMDVVEVREKVVQDAIKKKDFTAAKKLVAEGIKIAGSNGHPGTSRRWEQELLRIAVLENDINKVRHFTKHFAFDGGFHKEYYRQWKKTFKDEERHKVIHEIIAEMERRMEKEEIKNKNNFWYRPYVSSVYSLAPLYIEEKLWDRLWNLVAQTNDFNIAWKFHDYLAKQYPTELLELYLQGIEQKGESAGQRSEYAELVSIMKKINRDIPGANEKIMIVAQRLKDKYRRRPAMIEELNKIIQ